MLIKPNAQLNLDPGSPRRRSISGCKCLLIAAAIALVSAAALFFIGVVTKVVGNLSNLHRALYQNATLEQVSNRASVVQPLINRNDTFDIAATVWLRSKGSREHEVAVKGEGDGTKVQAEVLETPLYSDIVFRGLRLTDKGRFATVNFTLPTEIL
jgi:hypothetical protein